MALLDINGHANFTHLGTSKDGLRQLITHALQAALAAGTWRIKAYAACMWSMSAPVATMASATTCSNWPSSRRQREI